MARARSSLCTFWQGQEGGATVMAVFLLVALVLPMTPTLVQAQGAPAIPLVVCHVDQAPQMLIPAYLCQWYGGQQHH